MYIETSDLALTTENIGSALNAVQKYTSFLTRERPMGHICPMFFSCICYINITKKNYFKLPQILL